MGCAVGSRIARNKHVYVGAFSMVPRACVRRDEQRRKLTTADSFDNQKWCHGRGTCGGCFVCRAGSQRMNAAILRVNSKESIPSVPVRLSSEPRPSGRCKLDYSRPAVQQSCVGEFQALPSSWQGAGQHGCPKLAVMRRRAQRASGHNLNSRRFLSPLYRATAASSRFPASRERAQSIVQDENFKNSPHPQPQWVPRDRDSRLSETRRQRDPNPG